MKKLFQYSSLVLILMIFSGCASLTKDTYQRMQIETYSKDNSFVSNAKCRAKNEYGDWVAFTSGTLTIHRSDQNLLVTCEKDGELTGYATVISRANDGMIGNVFFGGGIGALLDHHNGNAYSYPDWIRIIMGENLVFDRWGSKSGQVVLGKPAVEPPSSSDKTTIVDNIRNFLP